MYTSLVIHRTQRCSLNLSIFRDYECDAMNPHLLFFQEKNEASLNLNHSVPLLTKLGLPANAALTMNSGSHGNGSYYYLLHSGAGNQKVGGLISTLQNSFLPHKPDV